jgi:hypothetical protein
MLSGEYEYELKLKIEVYQFYKYRSLYVYIKSLFATFTERDFYKIYTYDNTFNLVIYSYGIFLVVTVENSWIYVNAFKVLECSANSVF